MGIKQFTKNNLPQIRAAMNEALKSVEDKFGLTIDLGSFGFRPHQTSVRVVLDTLAEDGINQGAKDNFVHYAVYRGFAAEDFGRSFTKDGRIMKIVGWTNRRSRYPVDVLEVGTKKPWYYSPRSVLQALGKKVKIQPSFDLRG